MVAEETMTDLMEDENQRKMERGELKLTRFGLGFKLTSFTSFLGWTGMFLYTLLGLVALAMLTLPTDLKDFIRGNLGTAYQENIYEAIANLMRGIGAVMLFISIAFFILNFFLRKKNKEKNLRGVTIILTVICCIGAALQILLLSANIIFQLMVVGRVFTKLVFTYHGIISLIYSMASIVFLSLLLHGIRTKQSCFIKPFLVFQYCMIAFILSAVIIVSIVFASMMQHFWMVLLGAFTFIFLMFCYTFDMGFYITLHSIILANEKKSQYKKNIAFVNDSYQKC